MNDGKARVLLALLIGGVAAILVGIVEWRYAIFRNGVDLGIFTQVIASTGSGFSSTVEGGVNHLLVHWSPLIVTAWPFLRIFGPSGLEIAQALLLSATLIPLWGIARARFSPGIALALVAVCALYPILCANAVGDFHELSYVPLLSATLVYALDRRRWRLGIASALLLACTKEDQFVALAFVGAASFAFARNDRPMRVFGASVAAIAVAGAIGYFAIFRNVAGPHTAYYSMHFFDWSASPISAATLPGLLESRGLFFLAILAPLAFLPCFSRYGLFLIPGFVEIFASHEPVTLMAGAHYSALLTGYALVAFIDGAARIAAVRPRIAAAAVAAAAGISIGDAIFASPMEYWYYLYRPPNAHDAKLAAALKTLPADADVGAEDEIFSHLGLDPRASIAIAGQEWFVYDSTHYSERWHDTDEPIVRRSIARGAYAVASSDDGVVIVRRGKSVPSGALVTP